MRVVGLTGGIASGKSLAAELFGELGVPVLDTDRVARQVVRPGSPGLEAVVRRFSRQVLTDDGRLDRGRLRQIILDDQRARRDLEAILHPLIRAETEAWIARQSSPYCIIVVPLLFEAGWEELFDTILVVDTPVALQRRRLAERDGMTEEQIDALLGAQMERRARLERADGLLYNGASPAALREQVEAWHRRLLAAA